MKFNLLSQFVINKNLKIDETEMEKLSCLITDQEYLDFLRKVNGGSILNNAMNFYGILPNILELEIFYNNFLFNKYYSDLFPGVFVFAEDIFGNQFAFLKDGSVVFLNIETTEVMETFQNFKHFLSAISDDIDYYSGFSIAEKWEKSHVKIQLEQRVSPIKPFIIGGGYEVKNLHLLNKEKLFDYTSFIARQIKDLPDGTDITLKIV